MALVLQFSSERSTAAVLFLAIIPTLVLYILWTVVYRLYLDPLAKYPGPRLAALTKWWKTYKDCVEGWSAPQGLEKLHEVYGDVVRIGPGEVSSNPCQDFIISPSSATFSHAKGVS